VGLQDGRCAFPGKRVWVYRMEGVLFQEDERKRCMFTGALKNKRF
jgi:hypothetical protein